MQELVELNSNYGTLRDSKRKIDFYFSVGSERAYLIRKSDSFSAPFDILAVCDINLPQDEFESKYASALRAVSESSSTSVDSLVEQVRSIIGNDGSDVGGFEATRGGEGVLQSSAGSLRQDGESSGARSSDGDACFDSNGRLVAYRIGGKYVDERVRVRFRRATGAAALLFVPAESRFSAVGNASAGELGGDAEQGELRFFRVAEGGEAEIAFAARTEAAARRADDFAGL